MHVHDNAVAITDNCARLLRLPEVMTRTGLGRSQVYALMKQGKFPPSVKLSPQSIAFVEQEIEGWIRQRIEARQVVAHG